ncbi:hypothetical protein [Variovorax sp. PCZ-1]|uniref:hypothetical protein n=1 Tax=Variovorax sp. PCZ-1 TaxID=2835533 RepID=UPI001BCB0020|nr:hypothetical protein [Variovorax sp. PCZ-1]MBS7808121.1 hypothetical protein [Variovorax sp. PCZ-1]
MSAATFPVVRTTAEDRAFVESVLRPNETLSSFIQESIMERARARKEDEAFYARAMEASRRIDAGGKTYTIDEVMTSLRAMTEKKKQELAAKAACEKKAA